MLIGKNRGKEGLLSLKQNKSVNLITGLKGIKYHAQLKRLKSMKYILLINVKMPTNFITKASPCNEYPLTPHFYIVKLGFTGVYIFFLIFAPKQRLWVLVRTASVRRFKRAPTIYVLSKNKKNIKNFHLKVNIFTALKYCCILHGCVCIMS